MDTSSTNSAPAPSSTNNASAFAGNNFLHTGQPQYITAPTFMFSGNPTGIIGSLPPGFELQRFAVTTNGGAPNQATLITGNLPAGYHANILPQMMPTMYSNIKPNLAYGIHGRPNNPSYLGANAANRKLSETEKRANHNATERARRDSLNNRFQEIADCIPQLRDVKKPSKSIIMQKTLEYVTMAQKRNDMHTKEITLLKKENEKLKQEIKELKMMMLRASEIHGDLGFNVDLKIDGEFKFDDQKEIKGEFLSEKEIKEEQAYLDRQLIQEFLHTDEFLSSDHSNSNRQNELQRSHYNHHHDYTPGNGHQRDESENGQENPTGEEIEDFDDLSEFDFAMDQKLQPETPPDQQAHNHGRDDNLVSEGQNQMPGNVFLRTEPFPSAPYSIDSTDHMDFSMMAENLTQSPSQSLSPSPGHMSHQHHQHHHRQSRNRVSKFNNNIGHFGTPTSDLETLQETELDSNDLLNDQNLIIGSSSRGNEGGEGTPKMHPNLHVFTNNDVYDDLSHFTHHRGSFHSAVSSSINSPTSSFTELDDYDTFSEPDSAFNFDVMREKVQSGLNSRHDKHWLLNQNILKDGSPNLQAQQRVMEFHVRKQKLNQKLSARPSVGELIGMNIMHNE